jgi:hypothetical protein
MPTLSPLGDRVPAHRSLGLTRPPLPRPSSRKFGGTRRECLAPRRAPTCAECGKRVEHGEPHYREGLAWLHLACYKAKLTKGAPKFQAFGIGLSDQFESGDFDVTKPVSLCNPADKRGEGIVDPDTHLAGYEIKLTATTPKQPAHVKQTNLKITNQFHSGANPLSVDTVKPDRLLVPTAKSLSAQPPAPDPATHDVDHYKCYKVKVTPKTPKFVPILAVTVEDQFTTPAKRYDIKKPTRLCTPADKEHPAGTDTVARHPAVHLMCYQAALTKEKPAQPKHVPVVGIFVENQFDPERLDSVKEEELCVPSAKTVSGSPAATATTAAADDDEDVVTDDEDDD